MGMRAALPAIVVIVMCCMGFIGKARVGVVWRKGITGTDAAVWRTYALDSVWVGHCLRMQAGMQGSQMFA